MIVTKPRCRFRTKRWSSATTNNGSTSSSKAQRCAKNDHDHGFVILVRQMIMMVIFMIILVTEVSNGGQMPLLSDNARESPNWQLHEGNCHQNRVHDHQGWICFCYFCYFAIKLYLSRYDIVVHGSWPPRLDLFHWRSHQDVKMIKENVQFWKWPILTMQTLMMIF